MLEQFLAASLLRY